MKDSLSRPPLRGGFLLIALASALFALAPTPNAFGVDPPPDGGYPNQNTAEGEDALFSLTEASSNTAVGFHALYTDIGGFNTAVGSNALVANRGGFYNTAVGADTLLNSTEASNNTAVGCYALLGGGGSVGPDNVAVGFRAMYDGRGFSCTAVGANALASNTGQLNTAVGEGAMENTTTGANNTACGWAAMNHNLTGTNNTAVGLGGLASISTGNNNTVMGSFGTVTNTTGSDNAAFGYQCLYHNTTGSSNIAVGYNAGFNLTTGGNNIDIGNQGVAREANTIRIGTQGTQTATFIAGVSGAGVIGVAVKVNAAGQIGTAPSSARFKEEIQAMDKASEAILALKPVTFRYKQEIDPEGIPQFGLVAEQVEKVNPALVARDDQGKVYTVRYDAVNAMLLNEFIKEHRTVLGLKSAAAKQEAIIAQQERKIQEQEATITQLEKGMKTVVARLEEQASQIQKVSAQLATASPSRGGLETTNRAPQIVLNNQ